MKKQPSAIIIVRHGTRLDQTDKNWRATAEHPYDPPLSYGGWIQCQTLGDRIGKELQVLNQQTTPEDLIREEHGEVPLRPHKRRKIIIHSSPYKRCIQTSIAIAAGLRYPQSDRLRPLPTSYQRPSFSTHRPSIVSLSNNDQLRKPPPPTETTDSAQKNDRFELKVDPYLGEWLSTSYFEDSIPPASNQVILDRAQETLQRPIEEIRGADLSAFLPVPESPDAEDAEKENDLRQAVQEKGGLRAMAAAGHSLPHRTRTTSFTVEKLSSATQMAHRLRQRARSLNFYSPPVPQYSLAPQDPIPAGYVAHARDGCVQPDLTWNSEEMGWGNAGDYPEEWSVMHVRFRLGLQKLLAYYEDYQPAQAQAQAADEEENTDEDVVLVLVTHQAGANALIRLMTGAPALHDVGVASLTLAVRRPVLRRPPSLSGTSHSPLAYDREHHRSTRRGSLDLGLADDFEMRIIASTDHLRNGSNPLGLNSPRLGKSPAMSGRRMVGADSMETFSIGDPLGWRLNNSTNAGRSASQRGRTADGSKPVVNTGLWGSPAISAVTREPISEDIEDLLPMSPKSRPSTPKIDDVDVPETTLSSPGRSRSSTVQSAGLWGNNNPSLTVRSTSGGSSGTWTPVSGSGNGSGTWTPSSGSINRARSPAKRRWTAVSNSP